MNWALATAGVLALMGSAIHGFVGDRIVRRIDADVLPGNPFEGLSTKMLIRVTWHFTTIIFFILGVSLVWVGTAPHLPAALGVSYVAGAAFLSWALFALVIGFKRGGMRVFRSHPGPIIFVITTALISWGAARL